VSSRCTPQSGWTTRLKKYGGRQAIERMRARDFERLHQIPDWAADSAAARNAEVFLLGNPLRVLNAEDRRLLWPSDL
jgi:hypothetical protein